MATEKKAPALVPRQLSAATFEVVGEQFSVLSHIAPSTPGLVPLSEAEREVLRALARDETVAEIAAARGTTERTVSNQIASAQRKLNVASREEAVALVRGQRSEE